MFSGTYPVPTGLHAIPDDLLDLRSDSEVDYDLLHPTEVTGEKNVWFFWHSGFANMHPYTQRNVRAWHRRFSKQGWNIRVLDRQPSSPLNVGNFLDTSDRETFPQAFIDGTLEGSHAAQHTSDLVRFPLLIKYGGVYADVGMIQIGDLDRLWNQTLGNPSSPYEVLSYNEGTSNRQLMNYFLCSRRSNPFFTHCHKLLLSLWSEDGGKTSTTGMHRSTLLAKLPLMGGDFEITESDGHKHSKDESSRMLTDYIIQGQVITKIMTDKSPDWNGPQYVAEHIYAIDFMTGSQLINDLTAWNGQKAFDLMSLPLPGPEDTPTKDQIEARSILETILQKSFAFKLAHGLILKVLGPTLGSLWREYPGSDVKPNTFAEWLRWATVYCNQDEVPERLAFSEEDGEGRVMGG